MSGVSAPLEDPAYVPTHPPAGRVVFLAGEVDQ